MRADGGFKLVRIVIVFLLASVIALAILVTVAFSTIQHARKDTIIRACQETNQRHDQTLKTLDRLIVKLPPAKRQRAQQGRQSTVLIINSLAPRHDCNKRAQQLTK